MDKPRFIVLPGEDYAKLLTSLDCPTLYKQGGVWYVNAAQYREWKASLQHTSGEQHE